MSDISVGQPIDRVDGRLKVKGQARYAAEFAPERLAHAVAVAATISKGRIASIDASDAEAMPGVVAVITHKNAQRLNAPKPDKEGGAMPGDRFAPLQDERVHFDGQYVALAIAETFEQATRAA